MSHQALIEELRRLSDGEMLTCEIHTDEEKLFFFVRLPDHIRNRLSALAKTLVKGTKYKAEENDHITLLYIPRFSDPITSDLRKKVIDAAQEVAESSGPIKATMQGWGYFDGAEGMDDKPATAVVGLIDAPGLANIHVALHDRIAKLGINVKQNHGFTPHATFCYLPAGERLPKLPILRESFEITGFELSNDKFYRFPLKG